MKSYLPTPRIPRLAPLLALLALAAGTVAHATEYQIGPPPAWVEPHAAPSPAVKPDPSVAGGVEYLLSDVQIRVGKDSYARYRRFAQRALSPDGVEQVSNISITFDPSYEQLVLHALRVLRDGKGIDALPRSTLRVLQRERDLEYQIYDGSKTLNIVIADVRAGDIIEYSYTRQGDNPVFGGRFQDFLELEWSVPVTRVSYRLLWPRERKLHINNHRTDISPETATRGGYTEYRWSRSHVAARIADRENPAWHDPRAWVQLSEMRDWREVALWAGQLFQPDGDAPASPVIRSQLASITPADAPDGQRVTDILRFVQDEIRYLGIEMGERSHAPHRPEDVLQRRFGDCKDKTRLMVSMLRSTGIEAWPALVNTEIRKGLADYHPAMTVFNHALVRVRINGKTYWLDPTRKHQRGTLDTLYQPDYGQALVLSDDANGLVDMSPTAPWPHTKSVHEVIDLRAPTDQPSRFTVTSLYERYYADQMRETLANRSREEIQKDYTNYYANFYPGTRSRVLFDSVDKSDLNQVTTTEHYEIAGVWKPDENRKTISVSFYPTLLLDSIKRPSNPVRSSPLGVTHPVRYRHSTQVLLDGGWDIQDSENTVTDPAFTLRRSVSLRANTLSIDYEYRSLRDHVEAGSVESHVGNIGRARDLLGFEIYQPTAASAPDRPARPSTDTNWPIVVLLVLATLIWCGLAWLTYRHDPPYRPRRAEMPELAGIRGWLILPAIGLIVSPLRVLVEQKDLLYVFSVQSWTQLTTADGANPFLGLVVITELVLNSAVIVFGVMLAVLFFWKRHTLPRLYILYAIAVAIFLVGDLYASQVVMGNLDHLTAKDKGDYVGALFGTVIWVWYFAVSKRVRSTFTRNRTPVAAHGT